MTSRLLTLGLLTSFLALTLACSTAPTLTLDGATSLARASITGCADVQLSNAHLLASDHPGASQRLECALTAKRDGYSLSVPRAVFYFSPDSNRAFVVDASAVNQALSEQYGWKRQGDALKNDKKRVDSWTIK